MAFTCNVNASKAKTFNPEGQVSFLILSNILEYTWNNRHKYACNTIVSEKISKAKPWRQEKKPLKIILEVCSRFLIYVMLRQELLLDCINTMSQGLTLRKAIFIALPVPNFCESHQWFSFCSDNMVFKNINWLIRILRFKGEITFQESRACNSGALVE